MKFLNGILLALVLATAPLHADLVNVAAIMTDKATTGAATANQLGGINRTYFGYGSVTAATGACAIKVEVSNDNSTFFTLGTITLTLGTVVTADGIASTAPWKYVRGNINSISGTGAKCSLMVGSAGQ